jgi:hypothetical protein
MTESFVYVLFAIAFVLGMLDYDGDDGLKEWRNYSPVDALCSVDLCL